MLSSHLWKKILEKNLFGFFQKFFQSHWMIIYKNIFNQNKTNFQLFASFFIEQFQFSPKITNQS